MSENEKRQSLGPRRPPARREERRRRERPRYAPVEDGLPPRLLILLSQLHRRDNAAADAARESTSRDTETA